MKFIELTVKQSDGEMVPILFNVAHVTAFAPNPYNINDGGGLFETNGTFTKVEESYSQIKEKLNEI